MLVCLSNQYFIHLYQRNSTTDSAFTSGLLGSTSQPSQESGQRERSRESTGTQQEQNWAKTFKKHVAQRRALPTTIESFDEDGLGEKNDEVTSNRN